MDLDKSLLAQVVALLESVLDGKVDALTALQNWPEMGAIESDIVLDARHRLDHYASDTDIHRTNLQYERKQRRLLEESLRVLKENIR